MSVENASAANYHRRLASKGRVVPPLTRSSLVGAASQPLPEGCCNQPAATMNLASHAATSLPSAGPQVRPVRARHRDRGQSMRPVRSRALCEALLALSRRTVSNSRSGSPASVSTRRISPVET